MIISVGTVGQVQIDDMGRAIEVEVIGENAPHDWDYVVKTVNNGAEFFIYKNELIVSGYEDAII